MFFIASEVAQDLLQIMTEIDTEPWKCRATADQIHLLCVFHNAECYKTLPYICLANNIVPLYRADLIHTTTPS